MTVAAEQTPEARSRTITKIRTLIVDDEPLARSSVKVLLRDDPAVDVIGECSSGEEAIATIRRERPDLVFLDVQMPEIDGFDVLELLGTDLPPAVIFVTAYDQYALRAFDAGALDYVLKPFDNARFERSLARAKERLASAERKHQKLSRVAIKSAGQILFVNLNEIDWIEAADYYACLHVGQKSHLLRRSLADLEHDLEQNEFCRIHRSTIVNLERVRGMTTDIDGEHEVLLSNGTRLKMSRRYRKQLQERLGVKESS
jgi:two-component system LytT family response regulator